MGDDALHGVPAAERRRRGLLAAGLERILDVEPEEHAARRLVGALAEAVPSADCAALVLRTNGRLEVSAALGLDDPAPESVEGGLAAEVVAARALRLASVPGPPFPRGTRIGAGAPVLAGATAGALLLGSRTSDALDPEALVLLRAVAERAGLVAERARLDRELAEAVETARRVEAEAAGRRKAVDYILGIVGHDLRNPLGAVHMSAVLLQKKGGLQGWQARTVERMRSSAGRMGRIIADLLTYTRTRLGTGIPIVRSEARLDEIVKRVVDELSAVNPDRTIAIETEGDVSGEWDPDRLEQVASNLVSNAVDHGDPGAPVRVTLTGEPDLVSLCVCNEGPAMPPEVLSHIFEPFSRAPDEKNRKASGLGLGLFIAKEIVRAHGGEIGATSDVRTSVTVRLPRRPVQ
jgi:signal transduction histidine kinase